MKKILYILLPMYFLLIACEDLLEETPVSNVTDPYLNTPKGFQDAIDASYQFMRSFYGTERGMSLTVFGTDTYKMGADGSFKYVNQYTSQFDPFTPIVTEVWNDFYLGINAANAVISRADQIEELDSAARISGVAQARFLRAHYYFILVQLFGPVHLALEENTEVTTEATRAPIPDIYAAIIEDLEFAKNNLGVEPAAWGRATKPAAEHLLARVYLTKATSEASAADDYAKAQTYADTVINNYSFRLLPDFAAVFEQGSGEINDEVIWSVQYTSDPLTNSAGNTAHLYFIMEYDTQPGMQRDTENGRPFKRFMPTNYTLGLWNREIDSRYKKSFKDVFYSNNPATIPTDASGNPLYNVGDTAIWLPGVELSPEVIASKPYQVITPSMYVRNKFPTLTKFLDPLRPDRTYPNGSRDFLAFRLAETYLIAAEAAFYQGNAAQAAEYLNVVRRRAAWPGEEAAMEITAADVSLNFILDERARELLGEQFRWFDLKRTGTLIERVRAYNEDAAPNIQPFHVRRPIPQDQIDRTTTEFPQNEGYSAPESE